MSQVSDLEDDQVVTDLLYQLGSGLRASRDAWMTRGNCLNMHPNIWHPERGDDHKTLILAKAICSFCPVKEECLEYALSNNERIGVWGEKTGRQRRNIQSKRRKQTKHHEPSEVSVSI